MNGIDPMAAPPMVGPAPPDRQEMTFGEHLRAALQVFATRPLDATEMMDMKAFVVGMDSEIKRKQAAQGAMGPAGPEQQGPQFGNETQPYDTAYGSPKTTGVMPYGSQPG